MHAPAQRPSQPQIPLRNPHQAAAQRFAARRATADTTTSPALAWQHAMAQKLALQHAQPQGSANGFTAQWQPLGPSSIVSPIFGNLTGRITAVALDTNDATGNTVYLGTTGGGVWKSTNAAGALAAVTFKPLTDTLSVFSQSSSSWTLPSLSIGAIAVQPATNPVILAGTGDANDATDSYYGEGILRSTDGGTTWTLASTSQDGVNGIHSFAGLAVSAIAWNTTSPNTVVAAFSTSAEGVLVNASATAVPGLYVSTDAGVTWQMATIYDGAQAVQSPQSTGLANAATSVVWDAQRASFYAAVRNHGYYTSSDGLTWHRLTAQPGTNLSAANCPILNTNTCPIFRGTLAVQPKTGDLYALTVDASQHDQGLWQDLCNATGSGACSSSSPAFANRIDNAALETGGGATTIAQGDYNLALAALPASGNGTLLLAGTVDIFSCPLSSGASSCMWRNTTNALNGCNAPAGVAPSQHALAGMLPGSNPLVFAGNDGGLWRSLDGIAETGAACAATDKQHFDNLNAAIGAGGSLAEIVGFAQSPTDPDTLLAGMGANGTAASTSATQLTPWTQLSAGEGGFPAIDPNTPTLWYAAIGVGVNVKQCANGGSCSSADFAGAATVGETQVSWDAAMFDAPILLDPAATPELLTATCRVWRGPAGNGGAWSTSNAISSAFGGGATPCASGSPLVRSLAAGGPAVASSNAQNNGSQVIYAGLAGSLNGGGNTLGGHVFRTSSANIASNTTAWTDIAASSVTNDPLNGNLFNPAQFDVSSLTVDTHDATGATVYATIMGFGGNKAVPHVYRSTDFGAHWINVSANLPIAPVNALVIDPNDANTIYVATDAGVYATQAITTCSTANCWNLLGAGLPNAPVTTLAAGAKLPAGTSLNGMLRAGTYGRGIWQVPLLAATSTALPAITLSTNNLTFTAQQVSTTSTAQSVTVTNSGSAPLVIGSVATSGDFTETDTCAHQTLVANATCTLAITFAPTASGTRSGTLTIYANISGGQATVALTGAGTAPAAVMLSPTSLTFAATTVNATTAAQIVTVSNTGGNAATLGTPVVTGDFALAANTCGPTLAAASTCSLSITFTPTASGARSGTLSLVTSAGPLSAALSGTGNAPATDTLSPPSLTFAQTTAGATSTPLQVTLTNSGDNALALVAATSSSTEFPITSACGTSVPAHSTCAVSVTFAPSAVGTRTATLTVSDAFRTQTVSLTGTAVAGPGVSLSPQALSFSATGFGLTATAQTVTLTNNGGVALTITGTSISGDFTLAASTCGSSLAVSASCTLSVVFSPRAAGARTGALTLTDNATGSPTQTVALSGTGVDFTFAANGPTTATISGTNGSATYPLLLSSAASVSSSVALSCSGAPAHTTCTVTPSSTTLGSTLNVSAVVETGVAGASLAPSRNALPWLLDHAPLLALLAPMLLTLRRRRGKLTALAAFLLLALTTGLSGCGTNRTIPASSGSSGPAPTPTPSGTYNLTVSASSAGVTHTVGLTLIVQ